MALPLKIPFAPMEALSVDVIPEGDDWQYEPKWDGFRCLVFRDGDDVYLQSKSGQPLARYFPELVDIFSRLPARTFILDGEIAVPVEGRFSFDALLQRIHPAESRIRKLAAITPALFVAFDLLAENSTRSMAAEPLRVRRAALESFVARHFKQESLHLSPATTRIAQARRWLEKAGGDLDGIIAKRLDLEYRSGDRSGMQKVKNHRSADCVIGGFRYAEKTVGGTRVVGSLLLGLYDDDDLLHHVGFCSGLKANERMELTERLEKLIEAPGFTGQAPGGPSRWSTKRSSEWQPLKPRLVVEVSYDHFTGGRFRHGTSLLRWRPDKKPAQCRMEQIQQAGSAPLKLLRGKLAA
ncbi:MAG TPA: ATP-dependent DNA ligase [Verrucomicrobiae bacterium]|nr:ATP-dependent DNA ligase [Verrucomicrobiae bacterium]